MDQRHQIGIKGEECALNYLEELGYRLLSKNYRTRLGEIDLIMLDEETIVFIEVKTRSNSHYGSPQEAVGSLKQARIRRLAELFLVSHQLTERALRFDVVAIRLEQGASKIEHLPGVF